MLFFCPAITPCFNFCLSLVKSPLGYIFQVGDHVKSLSKAAVQLKLTKDEVNGKIEAAASTTDEENPTPRVLHWLEEVALIEDKAAKIETDNSKRTKCIGGCMPNFWSGYKIGQRAFKKTEDAKEANERGLKFEAVTERTVPVVEWQPSMPDTTTFEPFLETVRCYLQDNVAGVVGIWGMGGVGKTFLLQKIQGDEFIAAAGFDYVIQIVISREPDIRNLQDLIAKRLGLDLPDWNTVTTVSRAYSIHRFLLNKKFLLLLDDLWSSLDLQSLGVPLPRKGEVGQKQHLVLTSRYEGVCMKMQAFLRIQVKCLEWDAAYRLFEENLGDVVTDFIRSDSGMRSLAVRVAKKCGGLPLVLKTVAAAMSTKTTWREWQDSIYMLDSLQLPEMSGKPEDPFPLLKFSYDYLPDDRMRKCFLTCCLWPEDYAIPKDDLILCWMGHGFLDGFDHFRDAYNKGHAIIEDLKKASLLQMTEKNVWHEICVKIHDLIRDVALWISSDCGENRNKWLVPGGPEEAREDAQNWRAAEKISLMTDNIGMLPQKPHCLNLSTLILGHQPFVWKGPQLNLCIPDAFLEDMPALTYLDVVGFSMPRLPPELGRLLNLRYLNLTWTKIESLPDELGSINGLEYLILMNTRKLTTIPHGLISRLEKLKLLDLRYSQCLMQQGSTDSIVAELESSSTRVGGHKTLAVETKTVADLQRLSSSSRVSLWKLILIELKGVRCLQLAQFLLQTRGTRRCLQELSVWSCVSLQELSMSSEDVDGGRGLENLEELVLVNLFRLKKISWGGMVPRALFCNIHFILIEDCKCLKNIHWINQLPKLEDLIVSRCEQMEQVIGNTDDVIELQGGETCISNFPKLKRLTMFELDNLQLISNYQLAFPCLESFRMLGCPKLKKLPFISQIKSRKLIDTSIQGAKTWWDGLEWEEDGVKQFFEPFWRPGK